MLRLRSLAVIAVLAVASGAAAQQSRSAPQPTPAPATPSPTTVPFSPLLPPVAGGLTTGVPFPPPSATPAPDIFRLPAGQPFNTPPVTTCAGFGCPVLLGGIPQLPPAPSGGPETPTGLLRLDGTPADAQVLVDSVYVGTLGDIEAQRVLTLPEGIHHLEVRAADHQPSQFDIRIVAHDTVTYRVSLDAVRPPAPARPPQASAPAHMYVIPNCYIGNIPPRADRLPAGCDIKHVRII